MMELWNKALAAVRGGESSTRRWSRPSWPTSRAGALKDGTKSAAARRGRAQARHQHANGDQRLQRNSSSTAHDPLRGGAAASCRARERKRPPPTCSTMPSAPWSIFDGPHRYTATHDEAWRKVCGDFSLQQDQPWIRDCRPIAGFEYHRAAAVQWLEGLGVKATARPY